MKFLLDELRCCRGTGKNQVFSLALKTHLIFMFFMGKGVLFWSPGIECGKGGPQKGVVGAFANVAMLGCSSKIGSWGGDWIFPNAVLGIARSFSGPSGCAVPRSAGGAGKPCDASSVLPKGLL